MANGATTNHVLPRTINPRMDNDNDDNDDDNVKKQQDGSPSSVRLPPPPPPRLDPATLPLPCRVLPSGTKGLRDCAAQEIALLQETCRGGGEEEEEEDALDDGFVLCDLRVPQRKLYAWRQLFPRIKPFFALKCNPNVMVAAVLGQHVSWVGYDCASLAEIRLALESTPPRFAAEAKLRCIYANPQRAIADLGAALEWNVGALTFDGAEELHKVHGAHQERVQAYHGQSSSSMSVEQPPQPPEMVLRVLVPDSYSSVPLGEKFGAPPDKVQELTKLALELELPVIGVSFHCGSGCHDPQAYGQAIQIAHQAMMEINQVLTDYHASFATKDSPPPAYMPRQCQLLDIGGGFPGFDGAGGDEGRFCGAPNAGEGTLVERPDQQHEEEEETAAKIAAVVTPLVDRLFPRHDATPVYVISEPGRYFVSAAFAYCARIYSVRDEPSSHTARRHYYISQGVHGLFKDILLCNESFVPMALSLQGSSSQAGEEGNANLHPSTVHGPSGDEIDVVCPDCSLPRLEVGDWLLFDRMGAYTLSIAARCGSLPVRYVMGGMA